MKKLNTYKKLLKILFCTLFLGLMSFHNNSFSSEKIINSLKYGNKLIFIRHAYAPGNGDPENFSIKDCSTQRNLNKRGIEQAKKLVFFLKIIK